MRVSVVIPCRNAAAWLGEALTSVAGQSTPPFEVLVVDDGSTDASTEIARSLGARVIRPIEGGNAARARNAGWRAAAGDAIAFLDADDRWRPRHLERTTAVLSAHAHVTLVAGQAERFGLATGRFPCDLPTDVSTDARAAFARQCAIQQSAVVVRRGALEAIGGYDDACGTAEDYECFGRLAHTGAVWVLSEVTAEYRQHPTQDTRRRVTAFRVATAMIRHRLIDRLQEHLPTADLARLEAEAAERWRDAVDGTWRDGDRAAFDVLVAHGAARVATAGEAAVWRTRAHRLWFAWHAAAWIWRRAGLARWRSRDLLWQLVRRDLRVRYAQAALGVAWAILLPALLVGTATLLRPSLLAGAGLADGAFGTAVRSVLWAGFAAAVGNGTASLVANASLVGKVKFRRELLPIAAVASAAVDAAVGLAVVVLAWLVTGHGLSWSVAWLPVVSAVLAVQATALALVCSAAQVYFRDVRFAVQALLAAGVFLSPVLFAPAELSGAAARWMAWNPLTPLLEGARLALVHGHPLHRAGPDGWTPWPLVLSTLVALGSAGLAWRAFRAMERGFAERL